MAVKTDSVTAGKIISATVQYDNLNDTQRAYDIKGEAYVSSNTVQNINNGYVTVTDNTSDPMSGSLASFSSYGDANLSINFYTSNAETIKALTNAILGFIADVKADVQSKANNA